MGTSSGGSEAVVNYELAQSDPKLIIAWKDYWARVLCAPVAAQAASDVKHLKQVSDVFEGL